MRFTLKEAAARTNTPYGTIIGRRRRLGIKDSLLTLKQVEELSLPLCKTSKTISLSLNTKLLILQIKERYPNLSPQEISDILCIDIQGIINLFQEGVVIAPSKLNTHNYDKKL